MLLLPFVVAVKLNELTARALIDSGSFTDFVSTMLADQMKVKKCKLDEPMTIDLATSGSHTKVNYEMMCRIPQALASQAILLCRVNAPIEWRN
jgi:hypothetical protein